MSATAAHWLEQHRYLGGMVPVAIATFARSVLAGLALVVWPPADYFVRAPSARGIWRTHPILRVVLLVAKNRIGGVTLIGGVVMAIPLVPGPGLLRMLIGLGLIDFPGKRSLERRLLRLPRVLTSVNRLRARFKRPPIATE